MLKSPLADDGDAGEALLEGVGTPFGRGGAGAGYKVDQRLFELRLLVKLIDGLGRRR